MEGRQRNTKDLFIFSPLPLMKGCRWMTYHHMVHTSSVHQKGSQQTTMHLHQERKMHATQHKNFVEIDEHVSQYFHDWMPAEDVVEKDLEICVILVK